MNYLFIVVAILGLLDTTYLIFRKLQGKDVHCPFFPNEWCHKVQHSKQSKTFGVSNAYWGFLMYSAVLILTLLQNSVDLATTGLYSVVLVGFLFSMYFIYVQAAVLKAFCTWCVVSAINFFVLFVASVYLIISNGGL